MIDRRGDTQAIYDLLETYFEALYHADADRLGTVLHPNGLYVSTTEGEYLNRSIPEYLEVVAGREPPAKRGEIRNEAVHSIEFGGDNMAFVRLNMSMMGRRYTDFLTLYRLEKKWQIMTKIFSYTGE